MRIRICLNTELIVFQVEEHLQSLQEAYKEIVAEKEIKLGSLEDGAMKAGRNNR